MLKGREQKQGVWGAKDAKGARRDGQQLRQPSHEDKHKRLRAYAWLGRGPEQTVTEGILVMLI